MALANTTAKKGSGKRRRYRGKMVHPTGGPRAHTHGGHSPANRGWEMQGKKVPAPTKHSHRHGIIRTATTGERVN